MSAKQKTGKPEGKSPLRNMAERIVIAGAPLGLARSDLVLMPRSLSIPDAGIHLSVVTDGGTRRWRALLNESIRTLEDGGQKAVSTILFEERLGKEWLVAQRLVMKIAEGRIDAAIDSALA
ncbi:hypothetical protein [Roseibium sp. RKSG952]|uniref:hypothetical protein n=1 Tax=Roseibium sp. RKSG952 TaxID=2529384 RepID=UPI0012BB7FA7|nr:hypothetical protein [Roseibium sp. RKSG952]MTH94815.1 hypothetical protein [Roseibium sp. RKSG952]